MKRLLKHLTLFALTLGLLFTTPVAQAQPVPPVMLGWLKQCSASTGTLAIDSQEASNVAHHATVEGPATSPQTSTFDNVAGNLLVTAVVVTNSNASVGTPTVTYNGVAMTPGPQFYNWSGSYDSIYWFWLPNPATGSKTVSISWTGTNGTAPWDVLWASISFDHAQLSTQLTNSATAFDTSGSSTTATLSLPGTSSGNYVLSMVGTGSQVSSATAPTTVSALLNATQNTGSDNVALGQQTTTGGSVTAAYAVQADWWGLSAVEVKQSTGGCAAPAATSYSLNGPATGTVGVPTSNFTVASNGALTSAVTVTPSDNGEGGAFAPGTCTLPAGSYTTCTFTYTAAVAFTGTISATNSGSLINQNGIPFTASGSSGAAFYVCAVATCSNASDANAGTLAAPFATLAKAKSAMESSGTKLTYVRVGSYTLTATLSLGASDASETWQYYPLDGVTTAVLDGGNSTAIGIAITASNITINGLKLQNFTTEGVTANGSTGATISGVVIENNEIYNLPNAPPVENLAAGPSGIEYSDGQFTIKNNYVHQVGGTGIMGFAYNSGDTINGSVVTGNVVIGTCLASSDCGAIYTNMHGSGTAGGSVTISNNYVRDYGHSSAGQGGTNYGTVQCIYLDDSTSNTTVSGNVCAPPSVDFPSGTDPNTGYPACNNSAVMLTNGGTNDTFTGNIIDIGATSEQSTGNLYNTFGSGTTTFAHNIIVSKFTGPLNTCASGVTGYAYWDTGSGSVSVGPNAYTNYAAGGSVFSNGRNTGDGNPQTLTSSQMGLTATNGIYTLSPTSVAITGTTAFPNALPTSWGPPGFTIPSSTNHSP